MAPFQAGSTAGDTLGPVKTRGVGANRVLRHHANKLDYYAGRNADKPSPNPEVALKTD